MKELMEKVAGKTVRKTAVKKGPRIPLSKRKVGAKNPFLQSLVEEDNVTKTQNGAKTFKSTLNSCLDLFAMGGALRTRGEQDIINLFVKANAEDSLLALKCLFHIRNVRGGAGERRTFRVVLKYLGENYPDYAIKNIGNIVHYGRFDDLYELFGTRSEEEALNFIVSTFEDDLNKMENKEKVSLSGKWLPSENASSAKTKANAAKIRGYIGVSERTYRKTLSAMRNYIKVVEVAMSSRDWSNIDYSKIPSKASLNYRKAFKRHDPTGYQEFLNAVEKGEKKINSSALFPYEIAEKILYKGENSQTMNLLWDALPDYLEGNEKNILTVVDCSGSMTGRPMAVSTSLGLYTAERNKGAFHNYFITFSSTPRLQKVVGSNVAEKINNLSRADWGMRTDLQRVFDLILSHAVKSGATQKELPEQLIIVSDMNFDIACKSNDTTNFEVAKNKFEAAGYVLPAVCFWNVNSTSNNVSAKATDTGVTLVSGCSPSAFKTLLSGETVTPEMQMLETLNSPMYDLVKI